MARPKREEPNHGDRYEVKITLGRTMDGQLDRKSFFSTKSKQDARLKAEQYKLEHMMGRLSDDRVTFAEYAGKWLLNEKKQSVRGNTYEGTYRNCVEKHLIPYFGKFAMASVHKADIQKFLNGKAFLSESMLQKLRLTLNQIFEDACDNEVIYKNPCKHSEGVTSNNEPGTASSVSTESQRVAGDGQQPANKGSKQPEPAGSIGEYARNKISAGIRQSGPVTSTRRVYGLTRGSMQKRGDKLVDRETRAQTKLQNAQAQGEALSHHHAIREAKKDMRDESFQNHLNQGAMKK